jgi:hypothetical protein
MSWRTPAVLLTCAALVFCATGCSRQDTRLAQHKKAFESLGATADAIVQDWLGGQVSGTYARAALEKTFQLVEQERAALASRPQALHDPRGAALSQNSERLSRLIADLMLDVADADGASARRHVAEIPIRPVEPQ